MRSIARTPTNQTAPLSVTACVAIFFFFASYGQDVDLRNRVVTFTKLDGQMLREVQIVRGDQDGIVWRKAASGGRICYTNMSADLLESWGISSNRIQVARERAAKKALSDAQYRAQRSKAAQAEREARLKQDTEWRAGEPARKREAQRQSDLAAIETLRRQLEFAQERLEIAKALIPSKTTGDPEFANEVMARRIQANLEQAEVNRARRQLKGLEEDYQRDYGSPPRKPVSNN